MTNKNVLKIKLLLLGREYSLASLTEATDNSLYISFPCGGIRYSIDAKVKNIKFSYHPSGTTHMKMYHGKDTVKLPFEGIDRSAVVNDIYKLPFGMSFRQINTINDNNKLLDDTKSRTKYKNVITIVAADYTHLTIGFALKAKSFAIDDAKMSALKEIGEFPLNAFDLVVFTRDKWAGDNKTNI
ncbi:hypothetical protein KC614_02180 [candidate division WWE3 bacterium]|uniref:Uncharacterized protein n=1 Tax=candidate division WWE3 bacterium TaxID=2053526 RepID=A0A955RR02_UNCKA|nr:hypothetical protein [candidate division WWE3 bacterium]